MANGSNGVTKKFSSENLSEDSGYGDQLLSIKGSSLLNSLSNSAGNLGDKNKNRDSENMAKSFEEDKFKKKKKSYFFFWFAIQFNFFSYLLFFNDQYIKKGV